MGMGAGMADSLTREQRSERMARIKSRDTRPEMIVRRLTHRLGYRFRLHGHGLPGRPDMVLARHRVVIFVHGCFWHRHECKAGKRMPKSHLDYWGSKLARNVERDADATRRLMEVGWRVLTVWECETRDKAVLADRLRLFLQS